MLVDSHETVPFVKRDQFFHAVDCDKASTDDLLCFFYKIWGCNYGSIVHTPSSAPARCEDVP